MKARALRPGDRVALVAPSGVIDRGAFERGIVGLEEFGLRPTWREDIFDRVRYMAGSDQRRADELHEAFADPDVAGIICARGGYGATRLLPLLDYDAIAKTPKVFLGCSDISALQWAFWSRCQMPSLHGPVAAGRYGFPLQKQESDILGAQIFFGQQARSITWDAAETVQGGSAEGVLLGGCLSLFSALCGTEFTPWFRDAILFLEDVAEPPYRLDRMLTHLEQSGCFDALHGVVIGELSACDPPQGASFSKFDPFIEMFTKYKIPILTKFPSGHSRPNLALPLGTRVRLDADAKSLEPLERFCRDGAAA